MPPVSFGQADYERALADAGLADVPVFHRRATGSTNDDARALVSAGRLGDIAAAAVVVAETQTRGRGRGTNAWSSPTGSIAMTLIVSGVDASRLGVLPLQAGTATVEALRSVGVDASVKWPNDILIDDRKVAGILCESSLLERTARVFIGIGINVEAGATDPALATRATTLSAHGAHPARPALMADVCARILATLRDNGPAETAVARWKALSVPWWGEDVTVMDEGVERRVTLLDVSPEGLLLVRADTGALRSLASGDVRRIRPVEA